MKTPAHQVRRAPPQNVDHLGPRLLPAPHRRRHRLRHLLLVAPVAALPELQLPLMVGRFSLLCSLIFPMEHEIYKSYKH